MRQDKSKAIELRKQGKTYREIQEILVISRSTLSDWFKDLEWSKHIAKVNTEIHIQKSTEHLLKMNEARQIMLDKKYRDIEKEAEQEFKIYKKDPLFIAGLMLYAGEGDKLDKGTIRFANVDFDLHRTFIKFCVNYLKKNREEIKVATLIYPDLDIDTCREKWSKELSISKINFYKTQIIQGKLKNKKLHFGVGTTIILSSFLKRKLLLWIKMSHEFL